MNSAAIFWKCCLLAGCYLLLAWPQEAEAQGGFIIGPGASVIATGAPAIVITDGNWQNDGAFTAAVGLVRIEGSAPTANTTIGGTVTTSFYNLTQQKSANDVQLNQNIQVNGDFTMNGGLFQLNNFLVTLGTASGQIVNESETNRITGITGGEIAKSMPLNAPVGVNPGNLGAMITSATNMGLTTIRRGHVQQTDGASGISIYRYYDIVPNTNVGLNATLRQYYFDAELGTRVEAELEHFNSLNTTAWYYRNFTTRDMVSNYVENSGYDDFSIRWTLASPVNQPLPVTFVDEGIRCLDNEATLFWTVIEGSTTDFFQVEKSENQVEWTEVADGRIASQGAGRNRYTHVLTASAPYFRVREVDNAGAVSYSDAHPLNCNIAGEWMIWPNPTQGIVHIKAPFGQSIKGLEVVDVLGQVLLHNDIADLGVLEASIDLAGQLPAAIYLLKIYPAKGNPVLKKLEVRR